MADLLPNWNISRGFLIFIYIAGRISAAVRAGDIIFFSLAAPVWRVYEPKKTGARTRDQNPLVYNVYITNQSSFNPPLLLGGGGGQIRQ